MARAFRNKKGVEIERWEAGSLENRPSPNAPLAEREAWLRANQGRDSMLTVGCGGAG